MDHLLEKTLEKQKIATVLVVPKGVEDRSRTPPDLDQLISYFLNAKGGADSKPRLHHGLDRGVLRPRYLNYLGVILGEIDQASLDLLRDNVASISLLPRLGPAAPPNFTAASGVVQWGISALDLDQVTDFDGSGVVVGHIDSGVDASHPALQGSVAAFAYIDQQGCPHEMGPFASGWHGTHTAATICGRYQHPRLPRVGVATGAMLASAVVFDSGVSDCQPAVRIICGMQWAASQPGVKVMNVNVGLEGAPESDAGLKGILQSLRRNGILPVCAIGNLGPGSSLMPGNYSDAFSVGAAQDDLAVWSASSSQHFNSTNRDVPDMIAPGVNIVSALPGNITSAGLWAEASGTSMAAAHISGLAALLFQAKPSAGVDEVEAAIQHSCTLTGPVAQEGSGFPNAVEALQLLTR